MVDAIELVAGTSRRGLVRGERLCMLRSLIVRSIADQAVLPPGVQNSFFLSLDARDLLERARPLPRLANSRYCAATCFAGSRRCDFAYTTRLFGSLTASSSC